MRKICILLACFLFGCIQQNHGQCPEGYKIVPADDIYTKKDYCLSVYEMKNIGWKPTSVAYGEPWHLAYFPAIEACRSIGHSLPTNDLWQTLVRNAEARPLNWENGKMKADVTLSNGEKFYNVGDSMWEQVESRLTKNLHIDRLRIEDLNDKTHKIEVSIDGGPLRTAKGQFGPLGTYKDAGLGRITTYYKGSHYIMRGGDFQSPGLFGVAMNHGPYPDSNGEDVGFRCACPLGHC